MPGIINAFQDFLERFKQSSKGKEIKPIAEEAMPADFLSRHATPISTYQTKLQEVISLRSQLDPILAQRDKALNELAVTATYLRQVMDSELNIEEKFKNLPDNQALYPDFSTGILHTFEYPERDDPIAMLRAAGVSVAAAPSDDEGGEPPPSVH